MSNNGPCAVYNFYNCCSPADGSTTNLSGDKILLRMTWSGIGGDPFSGDIKYASHYYSTNLPNQNTVILNSIEPVHFKYKVISAAFLKPSETGTTNETMTLEYVVADYAGTILRTISTAGIDIFGAPMDTWLNASFSSNPADLIIAPNEVLTARFTLSNSAQDGYNCYGGVTVLAELIS